MKKQVVILMIVLLLVFCACQKPDAPIVDPDDPPIDDPIDDPGDPFIEPIKANFILVATYTENARLTNPAATATVEDKTVIALAPLSLGPKAAGVKTNLIYRTCVGDTASFNALLGQPVLVTEEGGKVKNLTAMPSVQGYASEFTKDAQGCYFQGKPISVDLERLTAERKIRGWCQGLSGIWTEDGQDDYIFNSKTDEIITLTDSDGDGTYDYYCQYRIVNGLKIDFTKSKEGGKVYFTNGGFGSLEYSGWFTDNGMNYCLCGDYAGKTLAEIGDSYVNVRLHRNTEKGSTISGNIRAYCEIYPAKTVTGTLEGFSARDEDKIIAEDNFVTVNGVQYQWTDVINITEFCDGYGGIYAGRLLEDDRIANPITLVFDMAGNVVKADYDVEQDTVIYTTFESANGTQAAAVFDVQGWWHGRVTTYLQLKKKVELLYSTGIRRLYVVTCNEGFPQFAANGCGRSSMSKFDKTVEAFRILGYQSPDYALADICHDLHMECYATYKIYEGGGMETVPYGYSYDPTFDAFEGFGGWTVQLDTFLTENLKKGIDYRICRRPDGANDNLEGVVDKITVDFVTGTYYQRGRDGVTRTGALSATVVNAFADGKVYTNKNNHPDYAINIWVSKDNSSFSLYEGDYSYAYVKGEKILYDANGDAMFLGRTVATATLEVTGLAIEEDYVAVTFENCNGLYTDPLSFMHLYSGNREIYSTTTDYVRKADFNHDDNPRDYIWGRNDAAEGGRTCRGIRVVDGKPVATPSVPSNPDVVTRAKVIERFYLYGFAFNFEPYVGYVAPYKGVICAGRGAEETFPGGFCEAYPEVREYWLEHTETLLKAGFDGVVIRLQAHSSIAVDYKNYGFNEPIVERYKEKFGIEAYNALMEPTHAITDEEALCIMAIRGEFFMLYAQEASELCHRYGKEFCVMLRESYSDPIISAERNEVGWWCMPKVILDWKAIVDLSDFVVIKDYIVTESEVFTNAKTIREYAKSQGKKVWIECYDDQAGMFTDKFFENAIADKAVDGVMLYELTGIESYVSSNLAGKLKRWGFERTSPLEK